MRRWVAALAAVLITISGTSLFAPVAPAAAQDVVSFTFSGGGWGHGVGMSQYGARGRGDAGQTAAQILAAYYPGTGVEGRSLAGPRVKLADMAGTDLRVTGGSIVANVDGQSGPIVIANPGERVSVRSFGTALIWQRVDIADQGINVFPGSGARLTISWDPGQTLSVSSTGRSYAYGKLRVIPASGTFGAVITDISMQQYLYGLGEMPASWNLEALRAQAIAGRSFAAYRLAHPQNTEFEMYASVSDQAYVGTTQTSNASGANWVAAVDSTDGQVVTSGGTIVQAFYSSSNGGHTERSDYVFSATLPYFVATPDPFDQGAGNPNATWTRNYKGDAMAIWLNAAGRGNVGSVTGVSITGNVGASGRVDRATVTISGTLKTVTMTGNQFRSAVNAGASDDLLSTKFSVGGPEAVASAPPPDTTAPDLKVLVGNPMRFGTSGNICAFVLSDEVAITAIHIRLGKTDLKSRVGGVGPTFPQLMCINIPPKLRPKKATNVVLTGAALDAAVNMRFVQQTVTIVK